jgi:hypothetical protein
MTQEATPAVNGHSARAPKDNSHEAEDDGITVEAFVREHGECLYKKVLAEFDCDAEQARRAIEEGHPMVASSLEEYMHRRLFYGDDAELDESQHPHLSRFIDYEELAIARWKSWYLRVVAHHGRLFFFETKWWWKEFLD